MVGEDGGVGGAVPCRILDKARNRGVPLTAGRLRERRVGDLADERVLEGQLAIALDPGRLHPPDEVPAFQGAEDL